MSRDKDAEKLGFCVDCPDHEACAGGYPCTTVKESFASFKRAMASVGDAAMKASAALTSMTSTTVTTRPRMLGGMDGDIVQHVSTTVAMSADRQIVERVVDEAEVIIRDYARTYGYRVIGAIDARSRVRNDTVPEIEVIVEGRLRPITDGIWGEVRAARAQDKADLEAVQRDPLGLGYAPGGPILASSIDASMITVGSLSASTVPEPSWSWSTPPGGDYAAGTMSLNSNGDIYRYDGSNWIWVATSTVN